MCVVHCNCQQPFKWAMADWMKAKTERRQPLPSRAICSQSQANANLHYRTHASRIFVSQAEHSTAHFIIPATYCAAYIRRMYSNSLFVCATASNSAYARRHQFEWNDYFLLFFCRRRREIAKLMDSNVSTYNILFGILWRMQTQQRLTSKPALIKNLKSTLFYSMLVQCTFQQQSKSERCVETNRIHTKKNALLWLNIRFADAAQTRVLLLFAIAIRSRKTRPHSPSAGCRRKI